MSRLKFSILYFAILTGGASSIGLLIDYLTVFNVWVMPLAIVVGINASRTHEEVVDTLDSFKSASLWAIITILFSFSVVVTYRTVGGEFISSDIGWIVLPGFFMIVLFDSVSKRIENVRSAE